MGSAITCLLSAVLPVARKLGSTEVEFRSGEACNVTCIIRADLVGSILLVLLMDWVDGSWIIKFIR